MLITGLYGTDVYTKEDLKKGYHLRWSTETCYGYMKEELRSEQFGGIRLIVRAEMHT